jgi:hypothetical protein
MPVSHVIVWAGNYGSVSKLIPDIFLFPLYSQNTYFHGEVSVEDAANQFQVKPIEHQPGGFFTQMPAFQVLNQFSKNGYSVLGKFNSKLKCFYNKIVLFRNVRKWCLSNKLGDWETRMKI